MPGFTDRTAEHPLWAFAKRVLVTVAIAAAVYLLWRMRSTVLLAFAAIIVAVLLLALTDLIRRFAPIRHRWALTAAVTFIVLVVAALVWLIGAQVQAQFSQLWQQVPQGIEQLEESLGIQLIGTGQVGAGAEAGAGQTGAGAPGEGPDGGGQDLQDGATPAASRLVGWVTSNIGTAANAIVSIILVVIAGIFLAARPTLYRRGAARLFPPQQQDSASETLSEVGYALRFWLIGTLISMSIVGVLVGLGTWLIGLPAPLALGVFAFLTEFIPIVGPILGAIPALLLAASEGGATILWTILLFLIVQQVESNLITPLVQEQMVTIPPALFILAVAAFGALFGALGVIIAAPLLVAVYVAVQKLWIGEALKKDPSLPSDGA